MTSPRLPPDRKKSKTLSVVMTEGDMEKLSRVAMFHNIPKSAMANQLIVAGLDGAQGVSDSDLAEQEARQETWRERMGLK
jgi:hypothetical protein